MSEKGKSNKKDTETTMDVKAIQKALEDDRAQRRIACNDELTQVLRKHGCTLKAGGMFEDGQVKMNIVVVSLT